MLLLALLLLLLLLVVFAVTCSPRRCGRGRDTGQQGFRTYFKIGDGPNCRTKGGTPCHPRLRQHLRPSGHDHRLVASCGTVKLSPFTISFLVETLVEPVS